MNPTIFLKIYFISVSSEDSWAAVEINLSLQKGIKYWREFPLKRISPFFKKTIKVVLRKAI